MTSQTTPEDVKYNKHLFNICSHHHGNRVTYREGVEDEHRMHKAQHTHYNLWAQRMHTTNNNNQAITVLCNVIQCDQHDGTQSV